MAEQSRPTIVALSSLVPHRPRRIVLLVDAKNEVPTPTPVVSGCSFLSAVCRLPVAVATQTGAGTGREELWCASPELHRNSIRRQISMHKTRPDPACFLAKTVVVFLGRQVLQETSLEVPGLSNVEASPLFAFFQLHPEKVGPRLRRDMPLHCSLIVCAVERRP